MRREGKKKPGSGSIPDKDLKALAEQVRRDDVANSWPRYVVVATCPSPRDPGLRVVVAMMADLAAAESDVRRQYQRERGAALYERSQKDRSVFRPVAVWASGTEEGGKT